ncbi:hypothetical protein G6F23_011882 [Rhizopus arrhizus]|nr:hypothetical protein G6F23_011882 [Rhizopus arrhizus]
MLFELFEVLALEGVKEPSVVTEETIEHSASTVPPLPLEDAALEVSCSEPEISDSMGDLRKASSNSSMVE